MKEPRNWVWLTLGVTFASTALGFWLPDGIARVAALAGQSVPIDLTTKISAAVVSAAFALIVEQSIMVSRSLSRHEVRIRASLESLVDVKLDSGIRDLLEGANVLRLPAGTGSDQVRSILAEVSALLYPISTLREPMRSGVLRWMQGDPLDAYRSAQDALTGGGVSATLSQHVAITKALFEASSRQYVQINQATYDPATQWSREWKEFLSSASAAGRDMRYIVLASNEYLTASRPNLRAMQASLRESGAVLHTCDVNKVTDSIGPFDLDHNLELFDEEVLKMQTKSPQGYTGGISLTMTLASYDDSPRHKKIVHAVLESAVPFKSTTTR